MSSFGLGFNAAMMPGAYGPMSGLSPTDAQIFCIDPIPPATRRIEPQKAGGGLTFHPSYAALLPAWRFLRISYNGGHRYKYAFDADGNPVFVKHEREQETLTKQNTDGTWTVTARIDVPGVARRMMLSAFKNYCRPGVDRYNDFVFNRGVIERDKTNKPYNDWLVDVDMLGTPMGQFMARATIDAQVIGRSYVGIQTNRRPELGEMTVAQTEAAGVRAYLDQICAYRVIDWRRVRDRLTECVVLYEGDRAVHWTDTTFTEYVLDDGGSSVKAAIGPTPHNFGRCPVVELLPFGARSQIDDIAELNKQLFNLDSLHRSELYLTHFTQFYATGAKREQMSNPTLGNSQFLLFPNPETAVGTIGSDTSQAESIRLAMMEDVKEIYRLFGLRSGDPTETGSPSSGVSKAWDFHEIGSRIAAIALCAQSAENELKDMWAAGTGASEPDDVHYPTDFNMPDVLAELQRTLDVVDSPMMPKSLKLEEVERLAKVLHPELSAAQLSAILAEAEENFAQATPEAAVAKALGDQRTLLAGNAPPESEHMAPAGA